MKANISEFKGCFGIEMEAETMKEAAMLIRFGREGTKVIQSASVGAHTDGQFVAWISIGKRRRIKGSISLGER